MQRRKLGIFLFFLSFGVFSFVFGGRVDAATDITCFEARYECGSYWPNCWNKNCSNCKICLYPTCGGGKCYTKPKVYCNKSCTCSCVPTASGGYCTSCCKKDCDCGCVSTTSGGYCKTCCTEGETKCSVITQDAIICSGGNWQLLEDCEYGCDGGVCLEPECYGGEYKCTGGTRYSCVDNQWEFLEACVYGCGTGGTCLNHAYCIDGDCDDPICPGDSQYPIECYTDGSMDTYIGTECAQDYEGNCESDICHPVVETCGGTLSCPVGQVSHIDNCGGMSCGAPCVPDGGGGGCLTEYPVAPELVSPVDGGVGGETVELGWEVSADYGEGCPNSNSQTIYLESGDESPDEELDSVAADVSSYTAEGLSPGETYYWRVLARNGTLSMSSDVYSFDTEAAITGYFFDSGGLSVCPADLSDPAYDSLKLSGGSLDVTGTSEYLGITTDGDGLYTAYVDTPGSYVLENFNPGGGYINTPDLVCDGTSVEFVTGGAGTAIRSFGFLRDYGGWWQAEGGDVYGGGGVESVVPRTCLVSGGCQPYLIRSDVSGESGLLTYLTGGMELGHNDDADVSADGWLANTGYEGQDTTYAYYASKMALLEKTSWAGSGKPEFNPEVGDDYEIYVFEGEATIDFDIEADEKMILMVDGNVSVSDDVEVAVGGHLTVIASGTITFESNVVRAEGWWVGDTLVIASTEDENTDAVFYGEGSFVGWSQVDMERDRGRGNDTQPTEEFVFRADLMINAPEALKFSRYVWQEKAP